MKLEIEMVTLGNKTKKNGRKNIVLGFVVITVVRFLEEMNWEMKITEEM